MDKLNELVALAEKADAVANLMDGVNPHTILAIAEAFQALEKRAEAAEAKLQAERETSDIIMESLRQKEAKLAELEKNEPVAYWHHSGQVVTREECHDEKIFAMCCKVERPLFTHPSPAADLVPGEMFMSDAVKANLPTEWMDGFNACRIEILRNIEDAK